MVEILVLSKLTEAVVSHAIQRISELLIHEVASLRKVKDDVEKLREELRRMQCFLRSAYSRPEQDDQVRNLVGEVRNVAYDIEDVIETYIVKVDSAYFRANLKNLRREIDSIEARIQRIFRSRENYGINELDRHGSIYERQRSFRRSYPDEEDDVISLDHSIMILKTRLLEEKDDQFRVVPIVGMGGLGKTTLVKKVYNDNDVKKHFDCCAWVFISQQYELRDVLSEILIQIGFSQPQCTRNDSEDMLEERTRRRGILNTLEEDDLIDSIKDELKDRQYLVVLDDVWRTEDWDYVRRVFPRGRRGSKIVFTTRSKQVASYANSHDDAIEPPFLTLEGSWELLQRKAFPRDVFGERYSCEPEYERIGKEMVNKCGGLPLAIVVLGGLLSTKRSYEEWQNVKRDVNSYLNRYNNGVEDMLVLSYHDLPYYLKPCFLYLGNFPEDLEIPREKLIQLWIAEGLITDPMTRRRTIEEIAELYLGELIDRCMIQIVKRDYTGVGIKTCRLHHLMRDFCLSKAREDNFSEVVQRGETITTASSSSTYQTRSRRIAVHPGCSHDTSQMHPHLRSLMYFDVSVLSLKLIIRSGNLKLLRVLKFEFSRATHKCKLPSEIGNLIHLRYLGLSNVGILRLPSSIGNLRNLGTLNLRDNNEVVLPSEILRLARLKHLLLPFNTCFTHSFSWGTYFLSNTTQIQTLKYVRFGSLLLRNKITQSELTNLRNLGVQFTSNEDVTLFLAFPNFRFSMLRSLHMYLLSASTFPNLQPLSQCVILSKLLLDGKISDGQSLDFLPASLTKLILRDSDINIDPMPVLENMPSLRFLRLHNSYNGSKMVCGAQGFPRLETLQLFSLKKVTKWRVELGTAMPSLKRLSIKNMPELRIIPQELRHITTLKELMICDVLLYSQVREEIVYFLTLKIKRYIIGILFLFFFFLMIHKCLFTGRIFSTNKGKKYRRN